jgi:membrane protein
MRLADRWIRLAHIYHREIWQTASLKERSVKGYTFAILRVVSITITVFVESRIVTRAAALSFSSLLGIGPLIGIAVLVAGFALGGKGETDLVAETLSKLIKIVAPQIQQYEMLTQQTAGEMVDPKLVNVIEQVIGASRSGAAGATGAFTLILIVLLLFKAIEDTFNDIWGVRQGRSVMMRIMFYWTVLSLGAVVFFTAVALHSASTIANAFKDRLPAAAEWLNSFYWAPIASFIVIAMMLTVFYRVIPNTRVYWGASVIGALVVATLLTINSALVVLYAKRVALEKNLYGSLALPLVIMFSLYVFWLCVLTGGIVSYAIQNVQFRNSQAAWGTLSESMRQRLALVVFVSICRRFRECLPPISASHLSEMLKVPTQLLNECLSRLVRLQLVTTLRPPADSDSTDYLYQPSRPLNRMTLFDFKTLDESLGEDPVGTSLSKIDPLIGNYDKAVAELGQRDFFQKTIEQLLEEHPFEERPPT